MGKKGGGMRLKRQMAPPFWNIKRKGSRFVLKVKPGSHSKNLSYPLGIVLRDLLKKTSTSKETTLALQNGQIKVDGVVIRDPHHGVGLMDVIEIITSGEAFRFIPSKGRMLSPILIKEPEKNTKLMKISSKVITKKGKIQYGFHDGKTLLSDGSYKVGDTCLVELPNCIVKNHIPLTTGCTVIITRGENAGSIGKVQEIKPGQFSLPRRFLLTVNERNVELPVNIIMAVESDISF